MKNSYLITIVIAVIVAGGGFYAGMQYQKSKVPTGNAFQQFRNGNGQSGMMRNGTRGRPIVGLMTSMDADTLTVKMQDGSSKIVNISSSTSFSKTDSASITDLKIGENIAVFGTDNSDGSVTAQNVQLNPMFRFGQGGGNGGNGGQNPGQRGPLNTPGQ